MKKNESKKLPLTIIILTDRDDSRFLNALKSSQIAKEIIVVNNNSNNDWKKLGREFHFQLVSHERKIINFAKIRNSSLSKVKTDWVFFLDSDESFGNSAREIKDNREKIEKVISQDLFDGVMITRKDVFLEKTLNFGEAGNTELIRMFKTKKGKFVRNVHEIAEVSGRLGGSKITISHFSHLSVTSFLQTIAKYSKMASNNERSSKLTNLLKMIFYPPLKFIQNYFVRLGFLDGYQGLVYAVMMSLHSLFVRVFYFEKYFQENNNE